MTHSAARRAAAAVLLLSAGCGRPHAGLYPVEGTVRLADRPLARAAVVFHADARQGNTTPHEPRGFTDEDGRYRLSSSQLDGAPPGWYRVSVVATTDGPGGAYDRPVSVIPTHYGDPDRSGLACEVVPQPAPGTYDLTVTPGR